ncbi:MAG: PHP domain-containing protein [Candidatus Thorarchaeota archaeon]
MFDYHIHPNYSIDAEGSIEEYCEEALRKGLKEIAFTTHLDTNSIADDCYVNIRGKKVSTRSSVWLEDYEASIKSADDKYQERGLRVRLGVEVDYIPEIDGTLPENFHSTEFDVILGSMHLIDHIAISDGRAEQAFKRYTRDIWKPHISDLANAMNTHSVGFEVNTSALRRGQSQPMPEASIINELKVEGVSTVTVGSDAHRPQDIGSDFEIAFRMLRDAGFSDISLFEKRKIRKHKIPY